MHLYKSTQKNKYFMIMIITLIYNKNKLYFRKYIIYMQYYKKKNQILK